MSTASDRRTGPTSPVFFAFPSFFPLNPRNTKFILNTEEVASLFHFPTEAAAPAPGAPRVEAKKRGEPSELPVE